MGIMVGKKLGGFGNESFQGTSKSADGLRNAGRIAMGFGQYDGTLDKAEQRVRQFAGCPGLLPGALNRDGLEVLRKVVSDRLEHSRDGLLHPGIRISKLQRKGTEQTSGAPKVWRTFFQMFQKGKGLFYRVRNSDVGATC